MWLLMRKAAIRTLTRLSWMSRRRLAQSLNRFSQVEADSAWQLLYALGATDEPDLQAKLFDNALEEVHHAAVFGKLAQQHADQPLPYASAPRRQLYDPDSGIVTFEAVHYVGEGDVYNVFLSYAHAAPSALVRDTFMVIRGDEEGHQELAYKELVRLAHSEREARRLIRRARWTRVRETVARVLIGAVGTVFGGLMLLLYYPAAAALSPLLRRNIQQSRRQPQLA